MSRWIFAAVAIFAIGLFLRPEPKAKEYLATLECGDVVLEVIWVEYNLEELYTIHASETYGGEPIDYKVTEI